VTMKMLVPQTLVILLPVVSIISMLFALLLMLVLNLTVISSRDVLILIFRVTAKKRTNASPIVAIVPQVA